MGTPVEARGAVAFRVVRHELPDGSAHYDLFVRDQAVPGGPAAEAPGPLITYELCASPRPAGSARTALRLQQVGPGAESPGTTVLCGERKADHRSLYWSYVGPIAGNRGMIAEDCRGTLSDFRPEPTILIVASD